MRNSIKITTLAVLLLLALFSIAQEDGVNSAVLRVDTNTYFHIAGQTQIVTPANINIQSSITGKGKLKIIGKEKMNIDAHGKNIANLCIKKEENSNLSILSELHIKQSLDLQSGTITLFDFNIFFENGASFTINKLAHIQFMGKGKLIHSPPHQLLVNTNSDSQLKQLFHNRIENTINIQSILISWIEINVRIDSFNTKPPTAPA